MQPLKIRRQGRRSRRSRSVDVAASRQPGTKKVSGPCRCWNGWGDHRSEGDDCHRRWGGRCGKTTVGTRLAQARAWRMPLDTFHPPVNIKKISWRPTHRRRPMVVVVASHTDRPTRIPAAWSPRRVNASREMLRRGSDVWFLHLHGPRDVLAGAVATRPAASCRCPGTPARRSRTRRRRRGLAVDIRATPDQIVSRALTMPTQRSREGLYSPGIDQLTLSGPALLLPGHPCNASWIHQAHV
jgi:gluconokinase